jgi:hypothetical protein
MNNGLSVLGDGVRDCAVKLRRESGTVLASERNPHAIDQLIADASVQRVTLVLRIPEAAVGVGQGVGSITAQEEASGNGKVDAADLVGVADESRETVYRREIELGFGSIDVGLAKAMGKLTAVLRS